MSEDKSRTINALLKRAQKDIHGAQSDKFREMAKRRAIFLRKAQRDVEQGKKPEVEFGEGYMGKMDSLGKKIGKLARRLGGSY
jgi:hypothetical protein